MRQAAVFLEASTGLDPASPRTWSGSAPFLFQAMRGAGSLDRTIPLRLSTPRRLGILARTFSPDRTRWRNAYYLSPSYARALTALARQTAYPGDFAIQIGARFSLAHAFPQKHTLSLNDGNFVERLQSGFSTQGMSTAEIDRTLRFQEQVAQSLSAVCTFSEYLRQSFIRNYHVPPDRVFNIGGAVNFTPIPDPPQNKRYTTQQLLFIGADFNRKGGPQLLQAFSILRQTVPDAQLHIVGPAARPDPPPGVLFHGHLSKSNPEQNARLQALFAQSSLFVLPSLYEPFGIAPLEAMLHEIPCVVTDGWALREMVQPGINGALVERGSVEDLAQTLQTLLADPERLATLGRQARATVLPRYTWPAVAERLTTVLNSL